MPHLSNLIIDLTGILPDAFGLDIGFAGGAEVHTPLYSAGLAGVGGINLIWHSRGDVRANFPELHVYYGYSATASKGSIISTLSSLASAPSISGAVQLVLAWAQRYDKNGVRSPASDKWVANGYNWTGTFWSAGFSIPVYEAFSLAGSYYQSAEFFDDLFNTVIWRGISLGVGISGKVMVKSPLKSGALKDIITIKPDVAEILRRFDWKRLKNIGINQSKTEYGMLYANGGDYIPADKEAGLPQRPIEGWQWSHWPGINQNKDK